MAHEEFGQRGMLHKFSSYFWTESGKAETDNIIATQCFFSVRLGNNLSQFVSRTATSGKPGMKSYTLGRVICSSGI